MNNKCNVQKKKKKCILKTIPWTTELVEQMLAKCVPGGLQNRCKLNLEELTSKSP